MPAEIETLWEQGRDWLKAAGAELVEVSLPHTKYALPAYYIVAPAEASSNLARYDGVRYGLRVPGRDIIDMYEKTRARRLRRGGAPARDDRHLCALGRLLRRLLSARAEGAHADQARFRGCLRSRRRRDADAGDAVGRLRRSARRAAADPVEMYLNDVFTVTVNMAGLPGIAVPAGLDAQGLPLGLQLIGRPFDEETLFSLGQRDRAGGAARLRRKRWW